MKPKNFAKQIIQYLLSWSLLQMRKHYSWERYIINDSEQFQDRVEVEIGGLKRELKQGKWGKMLIFKLF